MDSSVAHHHHHHHHHSTMLTGPLAAGFPNLHHIQDLQNAGSGSGSGGSSSPPLPGLGTPWSVQTSPSPPPPPGPNPVNQNQILNNSESDTGFYPPSPVHPAFFQGFSPVPAGPCPGGNLQGFTGSFSSPQMNGPPQNRRSPVGPQMQPQQAAFLQQRNHYNHHQKAFSGHVIAPPKFPRSAGPLGPKAWPEDSAFRTDGNSNSLLPLQRRFCGGPFIWGEEKDPVKPCRFPPGHGPAGTGEKPWKKAGIWFWLTGLGPGGGGGDGLVWTDHGVPSPGRGGEEDPPLPEPEPAFWRSWMWWRLGKPAASGPVSMVLWWWWWWWWWATEESIWRRTTTTSTSSTSVQRCVAAAAADSSSGDAGRGAEDEPLTDGRTDGRTGEPEG
ncbi:hypothetical protein CRUP_030675 [Coryphaenoides rupestris]|nr:hypothetical protein CRUP_030675 [Coryphaenoides rupestris]